MELDTIPWRETRYAGTSVFFYVSDERTGRVVALIRMLAGCGYPRHRHTGAEQVLVLRGGYRDEFGEHTAGRFVTYAAGSSHTPVALDETTCVLLAVAHEGVVLAPCRPDSD